MKVKPILDSSNTTELGPTQTVRAEWCPNEHHESEEQDTLPYLGMNCGACHDWFYYQLFTSVHNQLIQVYM